MVRKEFRELLRDPVILILVLWLYTAEVVICAAALTFDLNDVGIGVLDLDRTQPSVELTDALDRSPSFEVRYRPRDEREAARLLDRGDAVLVAVIPHDYGERLAREAEAEVQLMVDGSSTVMAATAMGDARRLLADLNERRLGRFPTFKGAVPQIENRVRVLYNPDLRFAYFMVISMIAAGAIMVAVIHPAAMIVKEKETGTIEQLLVSPARPGELIVAKTLPTFVIGLLALGPAMLIARAFDVPFRGDPITFAIVSAAFLVSAIATGVAIATFVRTLQQALLVTFFVLVPVLFLSGTMTPIESMPASLQLLSRLSPVRYYMEALLGVFLKGVGLEVLWPQLVWMLGLGAVLFAGSALFFRRRLV